jgi:hypothetical protein
LGNPPQDASHGLSAVAEAAENGDEILAQQGTVKERITVDFAEIHNAVSIPEILLIEAVRHARGPFADPQHDLDGDLAVNLADLFAIEKHAVGEFAVGLRLQFDVDEAAVGEFEEHIDDHPPHGGELDIQRLHDGHWFTEQDFEEPHRWLAKKILQGSVVSHRDLPAKYHVWGEYAQEATCLDAGVAYAGRVGTKIRDA